MRISVRSRIDHLLLMLIALLAFASFLPGAEPRSERQYLSGHGPADAVPWSFTVTGGRRAGEKATIPVPSNWELQGFGSYHYGQQKVKTDEHGLYQLAFFVPNAWAGRRVWLVFDGVMTDATVSLNGRAVGPTHQGGFFRFRYDVTKSLRFGSAPEAENTLKVDVAKVSANVDTEGAERTGDYWVFGGIYRPVWLEASPRQAIDQVAIDARADGSLKAMVTLSTPHDADHVEAQVFDTGGNPVGVRLRTEIPKGGAGRVEITGRILDPKLWNAETPNLYTLKLTLSRGSEPLHVVDRRFGFRTFEVREGRGLYVNGQRVLLKGVNRHSFRPDTGRALNAKDCVDDVRLIREMNMNAVRMSHYPPDEAFLDACDELGLYVLDEMSGWHHAHDTANGSRLVREMVERDVNHPSIVFWDNGNEGGNNRDLDGDFSLYDVQQRRVLHPWELFDGINTKHYPNYDEFVALLGGRDLVMPTEFLHGMYDGGAGAGLEDYWRAIEDSPVGAGGFIWVFADEGVVRTDLGGKIDVFSTFAPDGIVGPRHEREGSFYAIRDIWAPVQVLAPHLDKSFDGVLRVRNRYDFMSLSDCRLSWELWHYDEPGTPSGGRSRVASGDAKLPAIEPHANGNVQLDLPKNWTEADALAVTVYSPAGVALWTNTWPAPGLVRQQQAWLTVGAQAKNKPKVNHVASELSLEAGDVVAHFDPQTGLIRDIRRANRTFPLSAGPKLCFARPLTDGPTTWLAFADHENVAGTRMVASPGMANVIEVEVDDLHGGDALVGLKLELTADGSNWKTIFDATRRPQDGNRYEFPPQRVAGVRLSNVRRHDHRPPVLKTFRLGYTEGRFPSEPSSPAVVTTGSADDRSAAWIELTGGASGLQRHRWTMRADGSLELAYSYSLDGAFAYFGITFDFPEEDIASFRWLGEGPYRVWQNRLRGTTLGWHEHRAHVTQPGESWDYPEFEGYFAAPRAVSFKTAAGTISAIIDGDGTYLRVGTPRISAATTTVDFPPGEISFVQGIPAIGSKGKPPERAGPASQFAKARGRYEGRIVFRVTEP